MLKSLNFVDPLLASKIKHLELELQKVESARQEIRSNSKLKAATKDKLLSYQNECHSTICSMLAIERDKLAEYIDEQTIAITKTNPSQSNEITKSHNMTLNQSTKIDLSLDQSKSITSKTQTNRRPSTYYLPSTRNDSSRYGNKTLLRIRRLKRQLSDKNKLIKMLVCWIKIYYEREQAYSRSIDPHMSTQSELLSRQNSELRAKCDQLQQDIADLRKEFKHKATNILQTHQKCQQIRHQNSKLQMERKQLLNNARSLRKQPQMV